MIVDIGHRWALSITEVGSAANLKGRDSKISKPPSLMPDSFFATNKQRKRKRSTSRSDEAGTLRKFVKRGKKEAPKATRRKKKVDEELDSDQTNDEDGGIDDMDLRHDLHARPEDSGQEDEDETPAEKRLRLAQLYLDSVKEGLGMFYHFLRLSF